MLKALTDLGEAGEFVVTAPRVPNLANDTPQMKRRDLEQLEGTSVAVRNGARSLSETKEEMQIASPATQCRKSVRVQRRSRWKKLFEGCYATAG